MEDRKYKYVSYPNPDKLEPRKLYRKDAETQRGKKILASLRLCGKHFLVLWAKHELLRC